MVPAVSSWTDRSDFLTNRNRLSEEILSDVKEAANGYGVAIRRADVKDLSKTTFM